MSRLKVWMPTVEPVAGNACPDRLTRMNFVGWGPRRRNGFEATRWAAVVAAS